MTVIDAEALRRHIGTRITEDDVATAAPLRMLATASRTDVPGIEPTVVTAAGVRSSSTCRPYALRAAAPVREARP